ncbi:TPA: hypothetical protein ACOEHG_002700 [Enterobacter ludwigii]
MMLIALLAATGLSVLGLLFCIFMLVRNEWVFEARQRVMHQDGYLTYQRLPSYHVMMWHFWIWDVKKFIRRSQA